MLGGQWSCVARQLWRAARRAGGRGARRRSGRGGWELRLRTWTVGVRSVGVVFWWGDCKVLVIYEAVWRVGVGLELEMGGGDGRRE